MASLPPLRHRVALLLGAVLWLALAGPSRAGELTIYSTYTTATVYLRRSGTGEFQKVASSTPVQLTVDSNRLYDVRVEAHVSWFRVARGEEPKVSGDTVITIPMAQEWDTARLAWLASLGAALAGAAVGYRLRSRSTPRHTPIRAPEDSSQQGLAATSVQSASIPEGHRIGPFRVVEEIARGGMGTVYEVEDDYGDRYAMKVPLPGLLQNQEEAARFRREVDIGKTLHHPNVVRIFDYNLGETGPDIYIILELVRGPSLREIMRTQGPMDPSTAVGYMMDILAGLQHGHEHGIIHRDVKPGNILVADGVCKVTDYGIAKARDVTRITATHQVIGTPLYMAPEQLRSSTADARVDIYAAGVILFEMCTRHLPFDGDDQYVVFAQKLNDDPPDPRQFNPTVSLQLVRILFQALARNPDERYQTAQAFRDDLNWLSGLHG